MIEVDEGDEEISEHVHECPQKLDPQAECRCEVNGVFCVCIVCRRAFAKHEIKRGDVGCPECGVSFRPLHPSAQVNVNVNWNELMTLACWAEQYANHFGNQAPDMIKAVYAITDELERQQPMLGPLTVGRELGILREKNPTMPVLGAIAPVPPKFRLQ